MNFYIATSLGRAAEHQALAKVLTEQGHYLTYDWTSHGSVQEEPPERIREVANAEANGVLNADLMIVLLPGGRGTHAELGIAIGGASRWKGRLVIFVVGEMKDPSGRECAFYFHEAVTRVPSIEALLEILQ